MKLGRIKTVFIVDYTRLPDDYKVMARDAWTFGNDRMIRLEWVIDDEEYVDAENELTALDMFYKEIGVDRKDFDEAYLNICW